MNELYAIGPEENGSTTLDYEAGIIDTYNGRPVIYLSESVESFQYWYPRVEKMLILL